MRRERRRRGRRRKRRRKNLIPYHQCTPSAVQKIWLMQLAIKKIIKVAISLNTTVNIWVFHGNL